MAKTTYKCPRCGQTVTMLIKVVSPPSCENYAIHKTRIYTEMKPV